MPTAITPATQQPIDEQLRDPIEDRIDEPIVLISRGLWAGLVCVVVLVAAVVTWCVAGSWPRDLTLTGVVGHGTGPVATAADSAGTVTAVAVSVGTSVRAGDPVATITRNGRAHAVTAPVAGLVLAIDRSPGDTVRPGSTLAQIDPLGQSPVAQLFVTKSSDLALLDYGQPVRFASPSGVATGKVSGVTPVSTTAAALRQRWASSLPDLGQPHQEVWVVSVRLDARSTVRAGGGATAVVTLPTIRPYQLVFGSPS